MGLLQGSYSSRLSPRISIALGLVFILSIGATAYFLMGVLEVQPLHDPSAQGAQGDFIGGHLGTIIGSITLIVVILAAYHQARDDPKFRIRDYFLNGIGAISSYEAQQPATEQALRLLDYFALVALELDDNELLLILNTVIARDIRKRIEEIDEAGGREYPNAIAARRQIQKLLAEYYKAKAKQGEANDRNIPAPPAA